MEKPVRVEFHEFNLIKLQEMVEEVTRGDPKSMKEEREEDHYLFFVEHWVVVPMTRPPLEDLFFSNEPIRGKVLDVPFSD